MIDKLSSSPTLTTGRFDVSEICDLDISIARFILPRLQEFRKTTERTPSCSMTMEQWTEILDKMIFSFDRIAHGTEQETPEYAAYKAAIWNNEKDLADAQRRAHDSLRPVMEGLDLFHKYYRNLWW